MRTVLPPGHGTQPKDLIGVCADNWRSIVNEPACRQGAEVGFSDWGWRETGKIHARLTWNPWFSWQTSMMKQVVSSDP